MAKKGDIKYILKPDDTPGIPGLSITGIQTNQVIYKLAYDFNRLFHWDLQLQPDIKAIRKNKQFFFENYATSENITGKKIRLIQNKILIPLPHPESLFDIYESYYLFQKLETPDYVLIYPEEENLTPQFLQHHYKVPYQAGFIDVNMADCLADFPEFPV